MPKIYLTIFICAALSSCMVAPQDNGLGGSSVTSGEERPRDAAPVTNERINKEINDLIANAESCLRLAKTQYERKQTAQCISSISTAIQLIPNYPDAYLFLAKVTSEELDDKSVARIAALRAYHLAQTQKNNELSIEASRLLAKLNPGNTDYQLKLAQALRLSTSEQQSAIELYQRLLQGNPKNTTALLGMARTFSNLTEYDKALTYMDKYFTSGGNEAEAYFLRAYIGSKTQKYEQSVQDMEKVAKDESLMEGESGALAYMLWVEVLTAAGKYDYALNNPIFFGMTFFPQQREMFEMYRAIIYEKKGDVATADTIYEQLLKTKFADMIRSSYVMRTMTFLAQHNMDKAKETMDKFIRMTPKEKASLIWEALWEDHMKDQEPDKESALMVYLKEYLVKEPNYILGQLCLGTYYYELKKPEASQYLEKVIQLAGSDASLSGYGWIAQELPKSSAKSHNTTPPEK